MTSRKNVLSLVQPSGELTIGNYLGAMKQFVDLQDDYNCYFGVADLHSITVPQVAKDLRRRTQEVLALYLAIGLDPEKSTIFIQSQVEEHLQLGWVLNSISYMGQLSRMTQFKDKSQKSEENLNAALFTYPVLMAADILLYNTDLVPVGEDQRQHLELTRDLAERFNNRYSPTFTVPQPLISKDIGKIMSLKNPEIKMSKSDPDVNSFILILDEPDTIRRKIKRAVTDSQANFSYNDEQKGLQNLINIYSAFTGYSPEEIVDKYKNSSYGEFKDDLAEVIVAELEPIQKRYKEIMSNKKELEEIYSYGRDKAKRDAHRMMRKVYRKVGFVQ